MKTPEQFSCEQIIDYDALAHLKGEAVLYVVADMGNYIADKVRREVWEALAEQLKKWMDDRNLTYKDLGRPFRYTEGLRVKIEFEMPPVSVSILDHQDKDGKHYKKVVQPSLTPLFLAARDMVEQNIPSYPLKQTVYGYARVLDEVNKLYEEEHEAVE